MPPAESHIQALAATMTPSLSDDAEALSRVYSNFVFLWGDLPADSRRKLGVFVTVLNGLSWLRFGCSLGTLSHDRCARLLRSLGNAPVDKLQAGVTGLRSLLLMATYSEPLTWDRIDYAGPTINPPDTCDFQ